MGTKAMGRERRSLSCGGPVGLGFALALAESGSPDH